MDLSRHSLLLTGERPNMDATFFVSLSNEPLQPSAANVLQADRIAGLLKPYPNQCFVDTLTSIAIYGARVGFQGDPNSYEFHKCAAIMKGISNSRFGEW